MKNGLLQLFSFLFLLVCSVRAQANQDYFAVHAGELPVKVFYDYLSFIGKSGSQNKFPRVLNKKQAKQWLKYISKR